MLQSMVIVFREALEAGLIIGIVLAATKGVTQRGWWVAGGVVGGTLGACLVALFASGIADAFAGIGQELLNAIVLMIAVTMLTWHNVWMASHAREHGMQMSAVGTAVAAGSRPLHALSVVVGVAVLREGAEVVLFLYGIAASDGSGANSLMLGSLAGIALGGGVSALLYFGLLRIPTRHLFSVTSWMITLLAAGMAASAVAYLGQAGLVPPLVDTLWDTSHLLSDSSLVGQTLHTLVGYTDRPSAMQVIAYATTLCVIAVLMRLFGPGRGGNMKTRRDPAAA